ncbi:MAG: hypothetical protein ACREDO_09935 [Methyloceanibacter sp.]
MRELSVTDQAQRGDADWILKAMLAVASADGRLEPREIGLIQQVYRGQSGRSLTAGEIDREAEGNSRANLLAELAAVSKMLSMDTKEEMVRAAYLVLLADDRIAGEERKRVQDIATALQIPEIHFGAILEELAVSLAGQKS